MFFHSSIGTKREALRNATFYHQFTINMSFLSYLCPFQRCRIHLDHFLLSQVWVMLRLRLQISGVLDRLWWEVTVADEATRFKVLTQLLNKQTGEQNKSIYLQKLRFTSLIHPRVVQVTSSVTKLIFHNHIKIVLHFSITLLYRVFNLLLKLTYG